MRTHSTVTALISTVGPTFVKSFFAFSLHKLKNVHFSLFQVTRERVQREPSHNDSASSGFRYSTVVIVQHHPLFVTDRDRAYGVSCFYNDERHTFQQQLRVG